MPVYKIVKLPYINIDADAEVNCTLPPDVPNAKYTPLETYPARSEVKYECINSRYINKGTNNTRLVCRTLDNGETIWIGDNIDCQLSPEIGECRCKIGRISKYNLWTAYLLCHGEYYVID